MTARNVPRLAKRAAEMRAMTCTECGNIHHPEGEYDHGYLQAGYPPMIMNRAARRAAAKSMASRNSPSGHATGHMTREVRRMLATVLKGSEEERPEGRPGAAGKEQDAVDS